MTNSQVIDAMRYFKWVSYMEIQQADWIEVERFKVYTEEKMDSFIKLKFSDGSIWERSKGWQTTPAGRLYKDAEEIKNLQDTAAMQAEPEYITWHKDIWRDAYRQELPTWFISIIMTHTFSIGSKDFLELESGGAVELVPGMIIRRNKLK